MNNTPGQLLPPGNTARRFWAPLFYLLFFAAAAALVPFLPVYYQSLGLSGSQIGLLAGLPPLVMLFGASLWSALADAIHRHKEIFSLAIMGAVSSALLLSRTQVFLWLPPLIVAQAFFASPIISLADNAVMALLAGQREQYGKVRLWGAVGWGLSAPLVGAIVERSGLSWMFWIYALILLLGLFAGRRLPMDQRELGASFRRGMRNLLANRRWLLFLALVFIGGLCMSIINTFLFIYMDQLGASAALMGFSLSVATISELPVFFFSDRLITQWGARGLLVIAMGAYALRLLALSLADAAWMILPIQLLHGLTFSAMWAAGVSYASQIAPPGLGATAQGMFSGVKLGVGAAAGAVAGGLLYQAIGLSATFRWTGLLALLFLLAYLGIEGHLDQNSHPVHI